MSSDVPPFRLILIDRDPIALRGMSAIVKEEFCSLTVRAEFNNVKAAETRGQQYQPQVVVLDVEMDGGAGFDLLRRWRCASDGPTCLARLESEDPTTLSAVMRAGARGVILRQESCSAFLHALSDVTCGLPHLSPAVGPLLFDGVAHRTLDEPSAEPACLSPRERQIFKMLGSGSCNRTIADRLGCSIKTVQTHCARMCGKLCLNGYADLCRIAVVSAVNATAPASGGADRYLAG
jgi:DNA-binding NarL/FixJ family response regulator